MGVRLLSALIVSSTLTFASSVVASPLGAVQAQDAALRANQRRLQKRHHIQRVIGLWEAAEAGATGDDKVTAARGRADAWALMAHWSGRAKDRARAKTEKGRAEAVAKAALAPKPRWLRHVDAKTVDRRIEIRLGVSGAFDIRTHVVGEHRMFFDLEPVVVVRNALGTLAVDAPDIKRVRVGQYDDDTARVVVDFVGKAEDYRHGVHIVDGRVITIPMRAVEPAAVKATKPVDPREVIEKLKTALDEIGDESGALSSIVSEVKEAYPDVTVDLEGSTRAAAKPRRRSLLAVRTVVIDAGHGGKDSGARRGRTKEKDINLAIAKKVGARLKKAGLKVVYTRTKDEFVSLRKRAQIANRSHGDLFISIHANANRRSHVHGIETYFLNTTSSRYARRLAKRENGVQTAEMLHPVDDHEEGLGELPDSVIGRDLRLVLADLAMRSAASESKRLAGYVQTSLVTSLQKNHSDVRDLGVKHSLFYVLLGVRMPSVLIETGFVTHALERKRLISKKYQGQLAAAIAGAVRRFVEERDDLAMTHGEGGLAISYAAP